MFRRRNMLVAASHGRSREFLICAVSPSRPLLLLLHAARDLFRWARQPTPSQLRKPQLRACGDIEFVRARGVVARRRRPGAHTRLLQSALGRSEHSHRGVGMTYGDGRLGRELHLAH